MSKYTNLLSRRFCFRVRMVLVASFCFVATTAVAGNYPRGCEVSNFKYEDNYLVLNLKGVQSLFLIQNASHKTIELERHETKEAFMSPKLHSTLSPNKWSAFASDEENLYFKCYTKTGDQIQTLNCKNLLDICEYPRVKFALSNMGTYWVSSQKDQGRVIKDAIAKGIWLRW